MAIELDVGEAVDRFRAAYPAMSAAALLITGAVAGWAAGWLFLRQQIAIYKAKLEHLQDIREGKVADSTYKPIRFRKGRTMTIGISLLVLGLLAAVIGTAFILANLESLPFRIGVSAIGKAPIRGMPPIPSVVPVPSNNPVAAPEKTKSKYTESDVRQLLDALTEAHGLVENIIAPPFFRIESWAVNWQEAIPNQGAQGFARLLTELREKVQTEVWPSIDDFVYKKHARYKDEMRFALALDEEAAKGEMIRALDVAIAAVKMLPENTTRETNKLVEPQFKAVAEQIQPGVYKWIGTARKRIEQMTKSLRTTGEIEN